MIYVCAMYAAGLPELADTLRMNIVAEYSQSEERIMMRIKYDEKAFNPKESDNIILKKIAQNISESIEYKQKEEGYKNLLIVNIK